MFLHYLAKAINTEIASFLSRTDLYLYQKTRKNHSAYSSVFFCYQAYATAYHSCSKCVKTHDCSRLFCTHHRVNTAVLQTTRDVKSTSCCYKFFSRLSYTAVVTEQILSSTGFISSQEKLQSHSSVFERKDAISALVAFAR